ncbi:MAG: ferritin-like domain-containing protein [Phycisphaerae bacterium]|nr:ferritin-like domain-containing protein [Phycisphaerae bacterium]
MAMQSLHDVLVDLVKDTYHAEKQLLRALPKLAKAASDESLRRAFEDHLGETETHVTRLERVFGILEMKPVAKTCHGMLGLIEEGAEVMKESDDGTEAAVDAALIAAAQKVEHYEISAYGTMITFAETLGLDEIADIFKETLDEEEAADEKLSAVAEQTVNASAASAGEDDEEGEEGEEKDASDGDKPAAKSKRETSKRTKSSSSDASKSE